MDFDLDTWLSAEMQMKLLKVTVSIVVLWIVLSFIKKALSKNITDTDARYKTRKVASFIGYSLAFIIIATTFSNKLSNITVVLGAASVGIAFALQEVIASIAGWIAIMFRAFYGVGDRVQLKGIIGDVIDIGLLRTTLMETGEWVDGDLYTGRIVKVANSYVFKEAVFNYNNDFPFLWDEVKVAIKYGSDYALADKIFTQSAIDVVGDYTEKSKSTWDRMVRKYRIENARTAPMVTLVLTDNWVEYTIRYITDFKSRRTTKDKIFNHILHDVESSEGKIRFASATFEVTTMPPLPDNLNIPPQ